MQCRDKYLAEISSRSKKEKANSCTKIIPPPPKKKEIGAALKVSCMGFKHFPSYKRNDE